MSRRRWIILITTLPLYTAVLIILSIILIRIIFEENWDSNSFQEVIRDITYSLSDPEMLSYLGTFWVIGVALQAVFLLPVVQNQPPAGERSRSLTVSLIIGGLVGALICLSLLFTLTSAAFLIFKETMEGLDEWFALVPAIVFIFGWVGWSFILLIFVKDIWPDRVLGKLVGLLVGGTILEVIIILPIDIMVRRKTSCYCGEGTFFSLIISTTALLWLAGPGIVIALTSKKHRLWRETHCSKCGYAKGPTPGLKCPECGYEWWMPKQGKNKLPDQS